MVLSQCRACIALQQFINEPDEIDDNANFVGKFRQSYVVDIDDIRPFEGYVRSLGEPISSVEL